MALRSRSSQEIPGRRIDRYLDTNGDGTGAKAATGNYAAAAETLFIQPEHGEVFRLARMLVFIEDGGSIDASGYGNGPALSNGIEIFHRDDSGVISDMTAGLPVKKNSHWSRLCYDAAPSSYG